MDVQGAGSNFDPLALGRTALGRAMGGLVLEWLTGALPSDVDGLGRLSIACLAAVFSPPPEAAPTLLVLRSPRPGGALTWGVWLGCAEERVLELVDDVLATCLVVKGVDLAMFETEELI